MPLLHQHYEPKISTCQSVSKAYQTNHQKHDWHKVSQSYYGYLCIFHMENVYLHLDDKINLEDYQCGYYKILRMLQY